MDRVFYMTKINLIRTATLVVLSMTVLTGCLTVQLNLGANVNNVTVIKTQHTDNNSSAEMVGSNLDDTVKGSKQDNTTDVSVPATAIP